MDPSTRPKGYTNTSTHNLGDRYAESGGIPIIKKHSRRGIYSIEVIEQAHRAIHLSQLRERGVIDMITKIYNDRNTGKADYS